jgi:hypothetical protein
MDTKLAIGNHFSENHTETIEETVERLVTSAIVEVADNIGGFERFDKQFEREEWARSKGAWDEEDQYEHKNPDITLFRNPDHGWHPIDAPIVGNDKGNHSISVNFGETPFPRRNPAW